MSDRVRRICAIEIHRDHPDFPALAEAGQVVAYFGYGSLVNRATLRTKFLAIRRAEVSGWRRFWLPRSDSGIALLSALRDPGHATQGVVVYDHTDHLAAVDEREAGYIRRTVDDTGLVVEKAPAPAPVHIYEAIEPRGTAAETGARILQSYLDAVMQGFLSLYGREGVARFVTETQGFETEILCDRSAPLYPRSVILGVGEAELFDSLVLDRGARFRPVD